MRNKYRINLILIMAIIAIFSFGCTNKSIIKEQNSSTKEDTVINNTSITQNDKNIQKEEQEKQHIQNTIDNIDVNKIKPNENGKIMILMYHGIGTKEQEWVRTVENFKKDLQTLYDKGYRLISLKDIINNNINVEAGFTPFVLTFDDGLQNQFNLIAENGENKIDPNCAIGILEEFFKGHPDFGRGGSFFVYYPVPFRQKDLIKEKYEYLLSNGYEIGNHGYNHENLGAIDIIEIQKSLAKNAMKTAEYIQGYEVDSLALPYGAAPKDDNYKYVVSGEFEGYKYNNKVVLKVGSNPTVSPIDLKFDPAKLPRVRASELDTAGVGLYDWLAHFDKKPYERYISDGYPNIITIPEAEASKINIEKIKDKTLYKY